MIHIHKGWKIGAVAVVSAGLVTLAACGSDTKTDAPEPAPSNIVDGTKAHVIRNPEGFRNVAFSCFGPNGVYVTSRGDAATVITGSSVFVLANDANCVG